MVLDPLPKAAYTHGLELIYTLQDVDIASVRVLGATDTPEVSSKSSLVPFPHPLNREEQLEFDFGAVVSYIDNFNIIKSVIAGADRKKAYALLETVQLHDLSEVLPSEALEIRKLSPARKEALSADMLNLLRAPNRINVLKQSLKPIFECLIAPWILGRLGLASQAELDERWQRMSGIAEKGRSALHLFKDIFAPEDFYENFLIKLAPEGLYTSQNAIASYYSSLMSCAISYFRGSESYDIEHLISLIGRECACKWVGYQGGFIRKCLEMSPYFRVRKDINGRSIIRIKAF